MSRSARSAVVGGLWSVVGGLWSVVGAFCPKLRIRTDHRPLVTGHILFAIVMLAVSGCRESVALPLLFPVPDTTLTTETGEPLNLGALKGKVAIYDFIFTNCAASCPVMAASMRTLTGEIDSPDVRFVSISVDPARDTPPVLSRYAAAVRNDDRWIFLTGDREQILDLSVKSFKLAAGDPEPIPGAEAVLHSQRFVVVDRQGMIRGYYDGASPDEMKKLARDVRALLRA